MRSMRHSSLVLSSLAAILVTATADAATPFGANEFDAVFSDVAAVEYQIDRACLADLGSCLDGGGPPSPCGTEATLTSQGCDTDIHRFCTAKGQLSGWGVENSGYANLVDITCVTPSAAATFSPTHSQLQNLLSGCTTAQASRKCSVAIHRYCQDQTGFSTGLGPQERNASIAVVACVKDSVGTSFLAPVVDVENLVAGCVLSSTTVSTACRQAMSSYCQTQDDALRGGFGPSEKGAKVRVSCVDSQLPWSGNTVLPQSPTRRKFPAAARAAVASHCTPPPGRRWRISPSTCRESASPWSDCGLRA